MVKKAVYETSRKKEVGVTDLTLLSKISNESINDNLRKRFEHQEIYVFSLLYLAIDGRRTLGMYLLVSILFEIWGSIPRRFWILIVVAID